MNFCHIVKLLMVINSNISKLKKYYTTFRVDNYCGNDECEVPISVLKASARTFRSSKQINIFYLLHHCFILSNMIDQFAYCLCFTMSFTHTSARTHAHTHFVYTLDNASGTIAFKPWKVLREKELHVIMFWKAL